MDRFDTPIQLLPKPPKLPGITEAGPGRLPLEAGQQYRFSFNMGACIGCHTCEVACAEQNGLPPEVSWRKVREGGGRLIPHHEALPSVAGLQPLSRAGLFGRVSNGRLYQARQRHSEASRR